MLFQEIRTSWGISSNDKRASSTSVQISQSITQSHAHTNRQVKQNPNLIQNISDVDLIQPAQLYISPKCAPNHCIKKLAKMNLLTADGDRNLQMIISTEFSKHFSNCCATKKKRTLASNN